MHHRVQTLYEFAACVTYSYGRRRSLGARAGQGAQCQWLAWCARSARSRPSRCRVSVRPATGALLTRRLTLWLIVQVVSSFLIHGGVRRERDATADSRDRERDRAGRFLSLRRVLKIQAGSLKAVSARRPEPTHQHGSTMHEALKSFGVLAIQSVKAVAITRPRHFKVLAVTDHPRHARLRSQS